MSGSVKLPARKRVSGGALSLQPCPSFIYDRVEKSRVSVVIRSIHFNTMLLKGAYVEVMDGLQ